MTGRFVLVWLLLVAACSSDLTVSDGAVDADEWADWTRFHGWAPPGSSDFKAHWENQDIAVWIFSFRPPQDESTKVLGALKPPEPEFKETEATPQVRVFRRPAGFSGFDEVRCKYQKRTNRLYVMYANLDTEQAYHDTLVRVMNEIVASGI